MNKLEALNVVMKKQEYGVTVPLALKISVGGKWHMVTINREDKNIQKIIRVLVMMMFQSEVEMPKDYTVRVRYGYDASIGGLWKDIIVPADSPEDARTIVYLLVNSPGQVKQQRLIDLVHAYTKIVS